MTPSNSTAARPLRIPRRITGIWLENAAVRSRPLPLRSCQVFTNVPSARFSVLASYHSCSPAVTGGVVSAVAATGTVAALAAVADPAVFVAVTTTRSFELTSAENGV